MTQRLQRAARRRRLAAAAAAASRLPSASVTLAAGQRLDARSRTARRGGRRRSRASRPARRPRRSAPRPRPPDRRRARRTGSAPSIASAGASPSRIGPSGSAGRSRSARAGNPRPGRCCVGQRRARPTSALIVEPPGAARRGAGDRQVEDMAARAIVARERGANIPRRRGGTGSRSAAGPRSPAPRRRAPARWRGSSRPRGRRRGRWSGRRRSGPAGSRPSTPRSDRSKAGSVSDRKAMSVAPSAPSPAPAPRRRCRASGRRRSARSRRRRSSPCPAPRWRGDSSVHLDARFRPRRRPASATKTCSPSVPDIVVRPRSRQHEPLRRRRHVVGIGPRDRRAVST